MDDKTYPDLRLDEPLRFGKHKGSTLRQLIDREPDYVKWMVQEAQIVMDNEAFTYYRKVVGD